MNTPWQLTPQEIDAINRELEHIYETTGFGSVTIRMDDRVKRFIEVTCSSPIEKTTSASVLPR